MAFFFSNPNRWFRAALVHSPRNEVNQLESLRQQKGESRGDGEQGLAWLAANRRAKRSLALRLGDPASSATFVAEGQKSKAKLAKGPT